MMDESDRKKGYTLYCIVVHPSTAVGPSALIIGDHCIVSSAPGMECEEIRGHESGPIDTDFSASICTIPSPCFDIHKAAMLQ